MYKFFLDYDHISQEINYSEEDYRKDLFDFANNYGPRGRLADLAEENR